MKKKYFIFFFCLTIPFFIAAQQKTLDSKLMPSQPAFQAKSASTTKTIIRSPRTINHPNQFPGKGKSKNLTRRKIHRITTGLYGNEWINYSQFYYKIQIAKDGVYRIYPNTLANAGIPISSIDSRNYQIFFRGQQQYIYVQCKSTYLNAANGDYIEFYGQHNDGVLDSTLYYNTKFLPNPYYSLFNDTSSYYITWNASTTNNRMAPQFDTAFGSYGTALPYVIASTVYDLHAAYSQGAWVVDGNYTPNDPRFTQNSAWTNNWLGGPYGATETFPLSVGNIYTGAGAPTAFLRMVIFGMNTGNCTYNIYSNARNLWMNQPCNAFAAFDLDTTFSASDVATPGFNITYTNNNPSANMISSTYIYLSYPHTLALGGDSTCIMAVPDNTSGAKAYLNFSNFYTTNSSDSVRMYDLTNHNRFWVKPEYGGFNVLVPNSGGLKQCYLTSDVLIDTVKSLNPVGINRNGLFTNFTSGPDSAYLIITNPILWSGAQAYATYRQSKGYKTVVADVNELYDQFGYGVDYSPLGIRRFCNYAVDKWPSPPANLFLIGKGIHSYNFRADTSHSTHSEALVPSYGYPSSDALFTNAMGGDTLLEPAIPTGRLAALTNTDVTTYLGKVQTYESTPAALWMKNIAQFAGGSPPYTEPQLVNYLQDFASVIQGPLFGANIYLFQKSTPAPISGTLTDSIRNLIDTGVSIMNFFGHADGSNWDESIDSPAVYTNYGKYPFIIADACFSGDIFQPIGHAVSTTSEQFVLGMPGAIAFLASDDLGNPAFLAPYTQQIYYDLNGPFYRHPIGSIIQNTIQTNQSSSQLMINTCLEMTLHGDPAITLNAMDSLPDYAVTSQSIFFTPSNVTVLLDSFKVNIVVSNYGEAINQPVSGILTRTFPDGFSTTSNFTFTHIYYQDTVSISLPVNLTGSHIESGSGINYFSLSVNLTPNIDKELTLTNNSLSRPVMLLISSEDITPVWPYDYAIIPTDTATLKASTDDPFAPQRTYIFEIDTAHSFNSPLFRADTVTNSGGVIMARPGDNWTTTHFRGEVRSNFQNSISKTPSTSAPPITSKTTIAANNTPPTVNTNIQQSKLAPGKLPTAEQSHALPEAKQTTVQLKQPEISQSSVQQKSNMLPAKIHAAYITPRDSFLNGAVYYWRVRRDNPDSVTYPWVLSSFQYIKNRNGWGQSNFFQFYNDEIYNDDYNFINFNTTPRNWTFNANGHTLECFTFGITHLNNTEEYATEYKIDDYVQSEAGCSNNWGIYIAVIDPTTIAPWSTANYSFGNQTIGCTYPDNKFVFLDNTPSQTQGLISMLNAVPNGYYILAYSWIEGAFKASSGLTNDSLVVAAFQNLGALQMPAHRTTPGLDSVPWIFFVQKGSPSTAIEKYGQYDTSAISISALLKSNGSYGAITTPLIGPAARYDSLSWFQHSADQPPLTDSTRLNIVGIQSNGNSKTLLSNITPTIANLYISSINASLYPYIQLYLYSKDAVNHTPAQMNYWRVFYQPVPEIAMNPNIYTYFHADTIPYGDVLQFQTTVQNISNWPIDSTQLLIWTIPQHSNTPTYYYPQKLVKPLNPGDTAKVSFSLTDANASANITKTIWMEINPENYPNTRLEQFHFNNYAEKTFYSYGDKINPVLDVTFDGIHILNNDIVSPQPNILITFRDENKYLALNNPSNFQVYLRNITGSTAQAQQIPYGPTLTFTPAVLPQNKCTLLYTPTLADGTYELTVQGTDISGNLSANNSYKIDFQVINKSMISEVLNYPNPFSTSTRFVFILTGEKIPTQFKIQIMTVTGKIVKEISEDELGPIHIGRNITQYAWDGTDQYGSKLANGVYLYRVVTSINGQNIDDYQTAADQYFTKNWGKMFLMR